jgi:hypothetical protein
MDIISWRPFSKSCRYRAVVCVRSARKKPAPLWRPSAKSSLSARNDFAARFLTADRAERQGGSSISRIGNRPSRRLLVQGNEELSAFADCLLESINVDLVQLERGKDN